MKIVKPVRAAHTYVQHLAAPPAVVFPLLCPVREAEWVEGWDPSLVASESGVAERDCVFTTEGPHAVWYVTRHDPAAFEVEMVKVTPGVTACRLAIRLRPAGEGSEAEVTYIHTSLGPAGDRFVAGFTAAFYDAFMREWEASLNGYLRRAAAS